MPFAEADRVDATGDLRLASAVVTILAVAVGAVYGLNISRSAALALAVVLAGLLPIVVAACRGRLDALEIINPILVFYAIYFGVRTLFILSAGVDDPSRPDFSDTLDIALVYTLIGIGSLLAGYYAPAGAWIADCLRCEVGPPRANQVVWTATGLMVIGTLCRLWVYSAGYYTRFLALERDAPSNYLMAADFIGWASYYGVVLAAAHAFGADASRGFRILVWTVWIPLTFVLAFLGGGKVDIVTLTVGLLLARHYTGRRVSVPAILVSGALLVFVAFPAITAYRGVAAANPDAAPHEMTPLVPAALKEQSTDGFLEDGWRILMARVPGIDALALVVKFTPEVSPFRHGETIVIAPLLAFVPTAVWPGKGDFINSIASGVDFGSDYFGIENNRSGVAITQLGELYLNFGPLGVPLGMIIVGMLCRLAYEWFTRYARNPAGVLIYVFIYVHLIFIEGWFGTTYSNVLKHLVTTSVVAWAFLRSGYPAPPATAPAIERP